MAWQLLSQAFEMAKTVKRLDASIRDVIFLRYILIIAVSYLLISQRQAGVVSPFAAWLVAAALTSNVALGWARPRRLNPLQVTGLIVVVDTIWISLSLALIGRISKEFFFLYFFVLFFAALAENLVLMLIGVLGAGCAYMWVLGQLNEGPVWTQEHLLQVAFLFSAALFYGVLVNRARQHRHHSELIEAADRERTELLASLAHDIGGPAHVITLGVEALSGSIDQQRSEEQRTEAHWLMQSVSRNSRYLGDLVQHFLEYSRVRSGRFELNPAEVSVAAIVEQVAAQHAVAAETRGVTLTLNIGEMPVAIIDELALVRILTNLIGNALRYSEAGSAIVIDAALEDGWIRIDVGDSGPGMAAEQSAQIGQPFLAAPRTHGGAGLGLFIVRSLVEAHGGSLTTVSEAGKGARFTVRLPLIASLKNSVETESPEATSFLS